MELPYTLLPNISLPAHHYLSIYKLSHLPAISFKDRTISALLCLRLLAFLADSASCLFPALDLSLLYLLRCAYALRLSIFSLLPPLPASSRSVRTYPPCSYIYSPPASLPFSHARLLASSSLRAASAARGSRLASRARLFLAGSTRRWDRICDLLPRAPYLCLLLSGRISCLCRCGWVDGTRLKVSLSLFLVIASLLASRLPALFNVSLSLLCLFCHII